MEDLKKVKLIRSGEFSIKQLFGDCVKSREWEIWKENLKKLKPFLKKLSSKQLLLMFKKYRDWEVRKAIVETGKFSSKQLLEAAREASGGDGEVRVAIVKAGKLSPGQLLKVGERDPWDSRIWVAIVETGKFSSRKLFKIGRENDRQTRGGQQDNVWMAIVRTGDFSTRKLINIGRINHYDEYSASRLWNTIIDEIDKMTRRFIDCASQIQIEE